MLLFVTELRAGTQHHASESIGGEELESLFDGTQFAAESNLKVEIDIERVGKTFRMKGSIEGDVSFECGRCLERIAQHLSVPTEWVLMERAEWVSKYEGGDEEVELNEDDLDISFYSGEEIALNELIREAILLELPTYPVCVQNIETCDEVYARNVGEKAIEENEDAGVDLRWGPLKDIKLKH